jgi:hypothetical protein
MNDALLVVIGLLPVASAIIFFFAYLDEWHFVWIKVEDRCEWCNGKGAFCYMCDETGKNEVKRKADAEKHEKKAMKKTLKRDGFNSADVQNIDCL